MKVAPRNVCGLALVTDMLTDCNIVLCDICIVVYG